MKGQSLFEVVFALAVAALVLTGIVSIAATSVRNSSFARNNALATRYVQETSEWLREQRDNNIWADFSGNADETYCFQSLGGTFPAAGGCSTTDYINDTIFVRQVILTLENTANPGDTVEAEITVRWTDAQGLHTAGSTAQYTRWKTP
jgi:Tfp pilus assembly protein PilV